MLIEYNFQQGYLRRGIIPPNTYYATAVSFEDERSLAVIRTCLSIGRIIPITLDDIQSSNPQEYLGKALKCDRTQLQYANLVNRVIHIPKSFDFTKAKTLELLEGIQKRHRSLDVFVL